jgi:hypothetical protein
MSIRFLNNSVCACDRYASLDYVMSHDSHAAHLQLSWARQEELKAKPEVRGKPVER